ncbi:MAG TPA: DUF1552 domain-containing protein [Candidatus Acidoferrum sp.]|nr:DUF1552 domain-containing protein [Candidatus Acidoferrum sp.]
MFLTKKFLSRRMLLRGAGVGIALPLLDAMIPAATAWATTAAKAPVRMGFVFFPHGAVMKNWVPTAVGSEFDVSPILKPAEKHKSRMTIVSGLRNKPAESNDPHGIIAGTWLRCVAPKDQDPTKGITCDQIAASVIGKDTTFPSIELGTPDSGPCAPGYSCSFGSSLAFRKPHEALPIENNPRKLFYQLFGQGDDAQERAAIVKQTGSILDSVMGEASSLQRKLGASDSAMVGNYLDSVREIEQRVTKMEHKDMTGIDIPAAPVGIPSNYEDHLKSLFDLMALAYQVNMTNIATFMIEKEVSMRTFTNIGIAEAFHPLSHHGEDPDKLNKLTQIQAYHTKIFTGLLDKLAGMKEANGSVLDNSIILFGANMSNSDKHNNDPLPSVVFGHGGGTIKGGQHLHYKQDTPHANLLLTLLNRAGVKQEKFGDSTGELTEV